MLNLNFIHTDKYIILGRNIFGLLSRRVETYSLLMNKRSSRENFIVTVNLTIQLSWRNGQVYSSS